MLRMQSVSLILLALFSTNLAQQQFPFCPIGWHFGIQMGQCYLLPDDMRLDWHDADEYCRNVSGGQLVSVETRLEFDYLTKLILENDEENPADEGKQIWIGLTLKNAKWMWRDGKKAFFRKMIPNQPGIASATSPPSNATCYGWTSNGPSSGWSVVDCKMEIPSNPGAVSFPSPNVTTCYGWTINGTLNGWGLSDCAQERRFICKRPMNVSSADCPQIYYPDMHGKLTSPNYPGHYPKSRDIVCFYYVQAPDGYYIQLNFTNIYMEDNDIIRIYDGMGMGQVNEKLFFKPGGMRVKMRTLDFNPIHSTENALTIVFQSNRVDWHAKADYSWAAVYRAIVDQKTLYYENATGNLSSPNYPANYKPNNTQIYKIKVPAGNRVRITILDFQTEDKHDELQIVEGHFVDLNRGRSMAWLSGVNGTYFQNWHDLPIVLETKHSNEASLKFTTNGKVENRGFNLYWEAVPDGKKE